MQFGSAVIDCTNDGWSSHFWDQRLTTKKNHAWFATARVGKDPGKIEIVGEQHVVVVAGVFGDVRIGCGDWSDG